MAAFCALVAVPSVGSATGYETETGSNVRDDIEKAETKARGRVLAALGFGTQFCDNHDEGRGNDVAAPIKARTQLQVVEALPKN